MKISELIKKLEALKEEHGDIQACVHEKMWSDNNNEIVNVTPGIVTRTKEKAVVMRDGIAPI